MAVGCAGARKAGGREDPVLVGVGTGSFALGADEGLLFFLLRAGRVGRGRGSWASGRAGFAFLFFFFSP